MRVAALGGLSMLTRAVTHNLNPITYDQKGREKNKILRVRPVQ